MGVDHSGLDIFMAKKFLDSTNIIRILKYKKQGCLVLTFDSPFLFTNITHHREINPLHSAFGGKSKEEKNEEKNEFRRQNSE
jgi:hypothetical protein